MHCISICKKLVRNVLFHSIKKKFVLYIAGLTSLFSILPVFTYLLVSPIFKVCHHFLLHVHNIWTSSICIMPGAVTPRAGTLLLSFLFPMQY